jgi:hypothetical protein
VLAEVEREICFVGMEREMGGPVSGERMKGEQVMYICYPSV